MTIYRDKAGNWRTRSMFLEYFEEHLRDKGFAPVFTFKDVPTADPVTGNILPSFTARYLSYLDPTEYQIATKDFGGLDHWEAISSSVMLQPNIEAVRRRLRRLLAYNAYQKIIEHMNSPQGGKSLEAAKWVLADAQGASEPYARRSAGRPPKPPTPPKVVLDYAAELERIKAAKGL